MPIAESQDRGAPIIVQVGQTEQEEITQKQEEMLFPTVRLAVTHKSGGVTIHGAGSGSVVSSKFLGVEKTESGERDIYENFIITAHHVAVSPFKKKSESEIVVSVFCDEPLLSMKVCGKVVYGDKLADFAIVRLDYDGPLFVAKVLPSEFTPRAFQTSYTLGCPLGISVPLPIEGIIRLPEANRKDVQMGVTSAGALPGNSGGGVYVKFNNTYYLVGVISFISVNNEIVIGGPCGFHLSVDVGVPELAWYVTISHIEEILLNETYEEYLGR